MPLSDTEGAGAAAATVSVGLSEDDPKRVREALDAVRAQRAPLTAEGLAPVRATACRRGVRGRTRKRRESEATSRLRGRADIALCDVTRDAVLRRKEAASLVRADFAFREDGSGRVSARRSKNGPEVGGLSGRSPRLGMTQNLSAAGASLRELTQAGRWTSSSMPTLHNRSRDAGRSAVAKDSAGAAKRR